MFDVASDKDCNGARDSDDPGMNFLLFDLDCCFLFRSHLVL